MIDPFVSPAVGSCPHLPNYLKLLMTVMFVRKNTLGLSTIRSKEECSARDQHDQHDERSQSEGINMFLSAGINRGSFHPGSVARPENNTSVSADRFDPDRSRKHLGHRSRTPDPTSCTTGKRREDPFSS